MPLKKIIKFIKYYDFINMSRIFSYQLNIKVDENNITTKYIDYTNLQVNNPEDKEDYDKKCEELNKLCISLLNNNIESNIKVNNEKFNIKMTEKEQEFKKKIEKLKNEKEKLEKHYKIEIDNLEIECMTIKKEMNNKVVEIQKNKKDYIKKKLEIEKEFNENFNEKLNKELEHKNKILLLENQNKIMEITNKYENKLLNMENKYEKDLLNIENNYENEVENLEHISEKKLLNIENKYEKDLLNIENNHENEIENLEHTNETYQETIEKIQEENQNLQEELQKKNKRKSNKEIGDIGELNVCKILDIYYEKDRTIKYNQTLAYGCADIKITIDRYNGCIDTKDKSNEFKTKNTKKTVGKKSIEKLKRDVNDLKNNFQFGILISNGQEKFYDNKKDFEYILNNKKPIFFLKGINEEPEKLKILIEIIRYTLPTILSSHNDNELNKIKVKINKVSEKIRENIKLCNINKKNLELMKKNNNDNLILFNFSKKEKKKEKIEEITDKKTKFIQNKKECPYCKRKFSDRGGAYKQHTNKCKNKPKD